MSHDPQVLYDRLTQHVARCDDCRRGPEQQFCLVATLLLKAWGDSAKLADRQTAECDVAFQMDDDYQAELGRS